MNIDKNEILRLLSVEDAEERLDNLSMLVKSQPLAEFRPQFANNHIHTTYSFSPYTPTAAIWFARAAGLATAGIMDHDSIGGANEFRRAGEIASVGTTCGLECRVSLKNTPFADKKLNSPDQRGIAYMAVHSVPSSNFDMLQAVFEPLRQKRNARNRKMVARINEIMSESGVVLDFDTDVLPLSMYRSGGSITERHILAALANKIISLCTDAEVAEFLRDVLGIVPSQKQLEWLEQRDPLCFTYDILGVLKSSLNARTYIDADDELMSLDELVRLADKAGAMLCYAYLGDVAQSPTGDKKAEKFEDEFLCEWLDYISCAGISGITYMPSRNTPWQLERLMAESRRRGMTEISGEDINQPRQSFICSKLADPMFAHLVEQTWRMVDRER